MTTPSLPATGSTNWGPWAAAVDTAALRRVIDGLGGTSDVANMQAGVNQTTAITDSNTIRLTDGKVYDFGTTSFTWTAQASGSTNGSIIIDAGSATINYEGTGYLATFTNSSGGGNNPPRVEIRGGHWNAPNAVGLFQGVDVRNFTVRNMDTNCPNGADVTLLNRNVYSERAVLENIRSWSKQVCVLDCDTVRTTPIAYTATAATNQFNTGTTKSTMALGDRVQFTIATGTGGITNTPTPGPTGTTYYANQIIDAYTFTVSTNPACDGTSGYDVDVASDGTGNMFAEPQHSIARFVAMNTKLNGGASGVAKFQIKNHAGPYHSLFFNTTGNIADNVGVFDWNGAGSMGGTIIFHVGVEASGDLSGGAPWVVRYGQAGGAPPVFLPLPQLNNTGVVMYDPNSPQPDGNTLIFGQVALPGMTSVGTLKNNNVDFRGRARGPLTSYWNPSWYIGDGGGAGIFATFDEFHQLSPSHALTFVDELGNPLIRVKSSPTPGSSTFGVFSSTGATKQTVTGSRGGNAALASLITALANYGLVTDSTTA